MQLSKNVGSAYMISGNKLFLLTNALLFHLLPATGYQYSLVEMRGFEPLTF
jgi:hypothetical protein